MPLILGHSSTLQYGETQLAGLKSQSNTNLHAAGELLDDVGGSSAGAVHASGGSHAHARGARAVCEAVGKEETTVMMLATLPGVNAPPLQLTPAR